MVEWTMVVVVIGTSVIIVGVAAIVVYISFVLPYRTIRWLFSICRKKKAT